jgi:uncharacterized protein YcfJ
MLNPWLSFSLEAALFGWKTQSIMLDQMMRMTGVGVPDRSPVGAVTANVTAAREEPQVAAVAAASPVQAMTSAKDGELRNVTRKTSKTEKKRSLRSKRQRSR